MTFSNENGFILSYSTNVRLSNITLLLHLKFKSSDSLTLIITLAGLVRVSLPYNVDKSYGPFLLATNDSYSYENKMFTKTLDIEQDDVIQGRIRC